MLSTYTYQILTDISFFNPQVNNLIFFFIAIIIFAFFVISRNLNNCIFIFKIKFIKTVWSKKKAKKSYNKLTQFSLMPKKKKIVTPILFVDA